MESVSQGFFKSFRAYKVEAQHWKNLRKDLAERCKKPWGFPEFIFYFFVVVCLIGSIGIIFSFFSEKTSNVFNHKNLALNIGTSFIAVVASAGADLAMTSDEAENRVFRLIGIGSIFICVGLFWFTNIFSNGWSYIPSCIGLFIALATWWLANANSPHLTRQYRPSNAVPDVPVELPGNNSNYDV